MSGFKTSLVLFAATALTSFGTTLSFPSSQDPSRINGGAAGYEVFGVTLSQPTSTNPDWVLTIDMNYAGEVSGNTFEPFSVGGIPYTVGDFLIEQTVNNITTDYGIALSNHLNGTDGSNYTPGDLYQVIPPNPRVALSGYGFQTSTALLGTSPGEGAFPTWLAPGGTNIGNGTLTITDTGTGPDPTPYMYTVTDTFSAPAGFLGTNDPFTIYITSAICANGVLTGTGSYPPPPSVPEPGTAAMMVSGLLLLGFAGSRRKA
jgi:hypothetical protein